MGLITRTARNYYTNPDEYGGYQFTSLENIINQFIVAYTGEDQMPLPIDYVNYTKISWVDSSGIKHLMYPTSKTSNPSSQKPSISSSIGVMNTNSDTDFEIKAVGTFTDGSKDVVLDGDYDNIITGMNVYVLDGITSNIDKVVTSTSGITTITMGSAWGNLN